MFTGQLPKHISPHKLAYQNAILEGVVPVASCPQLVEMLADSEGEIRISLRFEVDDQRRPLVLGEMDTTLTMICQRCLEVAEIDIAASVNVAVVRNDDQARNLPVDLEPLLVEDETVELVPFVEQEILLNMPGFAYHENDECHSGQEAYSSAPEGGIAELEVADQRPNPFSVLAGLKTGK